MLESSQPGAPRMPAVPPLPAPPFDPLTPEPALPARIVTPCSERLLELSTSAPYALWPAPLTLEPKKLNSCAVALLALLTNSGALTPVTVTVFAFERDQLPAAYAPYTPLPAASETCSMYVSAAT